MSAPDWLLEMLGEAVADARSKLIDESWMGRRTTDRPSGGDLGWFQDHSGAGERTTPAAEPEHQPSFPELDRGIDR